MSERRTTKRYPIHLRVYFPEYNLWGHTRDISRDGCCILSSKPLAEGIVTDFLLELPIIGAIPLQCYIQHQQEGAGDLGVQFVHVRFSQEQAAYYELYRSFFALIPAMEQIRHYYLDLVEKGKINYHELPKEPS
ncbi:MAG: PilZ domain-containing protein [Dissulfuribacterales bacterium]